MLPHFVFPPWAPVIPWEKTHSDSTPSNSSHCLSGLEMRLPLQCGVFSSCCCSPACFFFSSSRCFRVISSISLGGLPSGGEVTEASAAIIRVIFWSVASPANWRSGTASVRALGRLLLWGGSQEERRKRRWEKWDVWRGKLNWNVKTIKHASIFSATAANRLQGLLSGLTKGWFWM